MTKIMTLTIQVTDEEFKGFIEHLASRSTPGTANSVTGEIDDNGPANANAPAVDSAGIPWIEAVHSAKKTLNDDGTWRGKRGVDKATRTAYENQARQVAAGNAQPSPAIPAGAVPPLPTATQPLAPGALPPAAFPAAASPFPPVAPAPADVPVTYEQVSSRFQEVVAAGKMQPDVFATWYPEMGINDPAQLATNETARKIAMQKLNQAMAS